MTMLFYKAWIETRVRFLAGLIAAAIVCIYYINSHAWLVTMWSGDFMRDPKALTHFSVAAARYPRIRLVSLALSVRQLPAAGLGAVRGPVCLRWLDS
jgi:uncharacterized membrane protein